MRRAWSILVAVSLPLVVDAQLEFTGSYWDTADYFRLTVDLESDPATLSWEVSPIPDGKWEPDFDKREAFTLELSEEEAESFRRLIDHAELCHSGFHMALGTGLSVRLTVRGVSPGELSFSYFSNNYDMGMSPRNAAEAEQIPLRFASLADVGAITAENRRQFFQELDAFVARLDKHRTSLDRIEEAYQSNISPPWNTILESITSPFLPEELDREIIRRTTEEVALVIDELLQEENTERYFPTPPEYTVVKIGTIEEASPSYYWRVPPHPDIAKGRERWKVFPTDLTGILADFVAHPHLGRLVECKWHEDLDIPLPLKWESDEEIDKRINFLKGARPDPLFFPNPPTDSAKISHLKIHSIYFEENLTKCIVEAPDAKGELQHTLLQVQDGEWKVLRVVDSSSLSPFETKDQLFK